VLAAIILPALIAPRGTVSAAESLPALGAATVAWIVWRRTSRLPVALFSGFGNVVARGRDAGGVPTCISKSGKSAHLPIIGVEPN
jgi:hypothetical protein